MKTPFIYYNPWFGFYILGIPVRRTIWTSGEWASLVVVQVQLQPDLNWLWCLVTPQNTPFLSWVATKTGRAWSHGLNEHSGQLWAFYRHFIGMVWGVGESYQHIHIVAGRRKGSDIWSDAYILRSQLHMMELCCPGTPLCP